MVEERSTHDFMAPSKGMPPSFAPPPLLLQSTHSNDPRPICACCLSPRLGPPPSLHQRLKLNFEIHKGHFFSSSSFSPPSFLPSLAGSIQHQSSGRRGQARTWLYEPWREREREIWGNDFDVEPNFGPTSYTHTLRRRRRRAEKKTARAAAGG